MKNEQIAAVCHEANRAYCLALGDTNQVSWDCAPEWQKTSAIRGVQLHLDNPGAGPSASHKSWLAEKVATGWVYGEVKDPEARTHPCVVPFDELPEAQQKKDVLFTAIVRALS